METALTVKNKKQYAIYIPHDQAEKYEELRWKKRFKSMSELFTELIARGYESFMGETKQDQNNAKE
jgi:hypothetical protein